MSSTPRHSKLSFTTVLAFAAVLFASASCGDSKPAGRTSPTSGGATGPIVGTGGAIPPMTGSGGATSPLIGTGGGTGSGGQIGTGGVVSNGGAVGTGGKAALGGAVGTGGAHTPGGAGGGAAHGGATGKGGNTSGAGGSTAADAGVGGACACTGGTTTLDCFCSKWSCPDSLSDYSIDGGPGFSFVTMEEFADCDLVRVNGLSPGLNPDQWVFERSTGRLVGGRYASDIPEPCPWDRDAGSSRMLFAGRFPETTCVRTRCVSGTLPQVLHSCPDGGV